MTILMVSSFFPPKFGGAGMQCAYLSKALKKQAVDIEILCNNDNNSSFLDNYEGIKVHRINTYLKNESKLKELIFTTKLLVFILKNKKYDIIHLHSNGGFECLLFPILKLLNKKILLKLTLAGSDDPMAFKKRKFGKLYLKCLKYADKIIAISSLLENLSIEAGIPKEKIVYQPNGVDTKIFFKLDKDKKSNLKKKMSFDSFEYLFLSIGKIEPRKGYDFLIESWRIISPQIPSAVLLIVGPDNLPSNPYYNYLKIKIQQNNLSNIVFTGKLNNINEFMQISDFFLFCSKQEGFGNVLLESAACGLKIVTKDIPGITSNIILTDSMGIISYSDSPEEFAELTIKSFKNRFENFDEKNMKIISGQFDIDMIAESYKKIYLATLKQ